MKRMKSCALLVLSGGLLFMVACDRDSIAEIKADPARFEKKDANIGGVVTRSFGVLNYGFYELEDGTGSILVVSQKGVPSRNAKIGVKGNTVNGFTYAGNNYGTVLIEKKRKLKN